MAARCIEIERFQSFMIYGHLSAPDTYTHLLVNPAWKLAFDWLKTASAATPAGIQKLQGDDVYVNVHGYDTLPRERCRVESHRRYLDLQYCISGGESIDWWLTSGLEQEEGYNAAKDVLFYRPAPMGTTLQMSPGNYVVFHPSDAHRPKQQDGTNQSVFKLVIKIDRRLVVG